ncbi:MAG: glycosyltransferase family 2 protein [Nitrospiraceae bacterium]|nr:MAG: glycosyltransferase family 2 protein [Nitrospiraceae bacterium]
MTFIDYFYGVVEFFFLGYFVSLHSVNLFFIIIAFRDVRRLLISTGYEDFDIAMTSPFTPPLSIVVPAYNEEKTIVESINSLLKLKFPRLEIIIVNDGSGDSTLEVLKKAFNMKRSDMNYPEKITTARVRGCYASRSGLPAHVQRFVLIDKENGGKADSLNAGINASFCPYFVSIDADSLIDEAALLQAFRSVLDREDIVAVGGQVAIVNNSEVAGGKVIKARLPVKWLVRFQVVEYLRSFTMGRTALSRLSSVLIISGVFGIFSKDFVQKIGGYLTRNLTSKVACEYTGRQVETVCEDMEIIVRIQRYIQEKKLRKRIEYVPHPVAWTEAPEILSSLAKQRNRWQRGLMETMIYHRKMLFNRNYGRIGLFAFPYFLIFELLGAPVELLGYITLPLLFYLDNLSYTYLFLFTAASIFYGIFISVLSVVISAWPEKTSETDMGGKSLIRYQETREIVTLVIAAVMENFGYRQLTMWWRIKAIADFIKGKKGWEKFERKGFAVK